MQADVLRVQGGGLIHSTHIDIQARILVVHDLGEIVGDLHTISCTSGYSGTSGTVGTGNI